MLEFDKNGHLFPYESITCNLEILKNTFIDSFPNSETRFSLGKTYEQFSNDIQQLELKEFFQFLNGSFVTQKLNPRDIDVVSFIDFQMYEAQEKRFKELKVHYKDLNIDCYFVKKYPEKHKYFIRYRTDMLYWNDLFTKSRKRQHKGYLKLKF